MDSTGLAVGLKKGFVVEKRQMAPRPASRKGVSPAEPIGALLTCAAFSTRLVVRRRGGGSVNVCGESPW